MQVSIWWIPTTLVLTLLFATIVLGIITASGREEKRADERY